MKRILSLSLLCMMSVTYAYTPSRNFQEGFDIGAEWIYFSPVSESTYYSFSGSTTTPSSLTPVHINHNVNSFDNFNSGYRVFAGYQLCPSNFITGSYTNFSTRHSAESAVSDAFPALASDLLPPDLIFSSIGTNQHFCYEAADLIVGMKLLGNYCLDFTGFAGVHYAKLRNTIHLVGIDSTMPATLDYTYNDRFWGVGPEAGLAIEAPIGCGFGLKCTSTLAYIFGRPSAHLDANATSTLFGVANSFVTETSTNRGVPYTNLRIAGLYEFCLPTHWFACLSHGINGEIELGYEALCYYNALITAGLTGVPNELRNVVLHGPVVSLGLNF